MLFLYYYYYHLQCIYYYYIYIGTSEKIFKEPNLLFNELQLYINKTLEFYVYNSVTDEVRNIIIMPSNEWGGEGSNICSM